MKGFTLVETVTILALLGIVCLIGVPLVVNSVESSKETNRVNKVKVFSQEVKKSYLNTLAENEFYVFDNEEKGGVTDGRIVHFTNDWLKDNVFVSGITCYGGDDFGNVFYDLYSNNITLENCLVDGVYIYDYINDEVVKR